MGVRYNGVIPHLSDQGTFSPVGAQGDSTFPPEFCNEICTIYVRYKKSQF